MKKEKESDAVRFDYSGERKAAAKAWMKEGRKEKHLEFLGIGELSELAAKATSLIRCVINR